MFGREGAVQVHLDDADLLALGTQVRHRFLGSLCAGAHQHHHGLGIGSTVIIEQLVIPAGELVDLVHIVFHDTGQRRKVLVAALPALEEDIGVDRGAPGGGVLRIHAVFPEGTQLVVIHQLSQIVIIQSVNFLHLVGGAEAVEEVQEGVAGLDGGQMCHSAQVHGLLRRGGRQHGKTDHPAAHHVGVIAENAQSMGGYRTGRDVEHTGEKFTRDFIHGRDHQQKTLRRGIGGGQGTGLQRAVTSSGRAGLGLHLHHPDGLAEDVLFAVGRPGVHLFGHGGGRRDGEDAGYFGKRIGDVGRGGISVHDNAFPAHVSIPFS